MVDCCTVQSVHGEFGSAVYHTIAIRIYHNFYIYTNTSLCTWPAACQRLAPSLNSPPALS